MRRVATQTDEAIQNQGIGAAIRAPNVVSRGALFDPSLLDPQDRRCYEATIDREARALKSLSLGTAEREKKIYREGVLLGAIIGYFTILTLVVVLKFAFDIDQL